MARPEFAVPAAGRYSARRRANGSPLLPTAGSLIQPERDNQITRRNGNQLFAIGRIADRRCEHRSIGGEGPEAFARGGVQRKYHSLQRSAENQITRGGHHAAPWGSKNPVLPLDVSGSRLDGEHLAPAFLGRADGSRYRASDCRIVRAGVRLGHRGWRRARVGRRIRGWMRKRVLRKHPVLLAREYVEQPGQRAVAVRHPVSAAVDAGPDAIVALRCRLIAVDWFRPSDFVEAFGPGLLEIGRASCRERV